MHIENRIVRGVVIAMAVAMLPFLVAAARRNRANVVLANVVMTHASNYSPCGLPSAAPDPVALSAAKTAAARATTAGTMRNAASALLVSGDLDGASAMYDSVLRLDSTDVVAMLRQAQIAASRGDTARAAALLRRASSADAAQLSWDGYGRIAANDLREAGQCFDIAIALDPQSAAARVGKGRVLLQEQQTDAAFAELDRAVRLCPRCATALFYRGTARLLRGEPVALGEADLKAAADLAPDDIEIQSGWARFLSSAFRKEDAARVWRRVRALS